ncbi:mannitol dehydrogenase family protein [Raineyella fluvialis]|uniref:mannitol dehydrogenase family protein n=1 Tax=Raineyella fluvialis TaxID=2662261 RepID=UPI001EEFF152|nr:mannitol dehydrogenase family protein [Raineyella fluvialis]
MLERAVGHTGVKVVGSVREVLFPADELDAVLARIAAPTTRIVTLTVTEKGYRRNAEGGLDVTDPVVAADLTGGRPASAVGRLVRGLQARADLCDLPLTVVCCDNLTDNGTVLRRLVLEFCDALPEGADLRRWIGSHVTFPCTMVDRIVPATTDADRALGREVLGLEDDGLVTAELFKQWVIEDRFSAERPAWELVGAQFTADVAPYEAMKLRTLNGTHSTLAYLGALRGYRTIAESVADPELLDIARRLIAEDVIPVLERPDGEDLEAYGESVLERFANPALAHRTTQIAMDGSQKIPLRLLETVRDNLARGHQPHTALLGVAAWMAYLASPQGKGGLDLPIDDPMADCLASLVRGRTDAAGVVDRLLGLQEIFGDDLPQVAAVRDELVEDVAGLLV